MTRRALSRASLAGIVLAALAIAYITLAEEPPHWGSLLPQGEVAQSQGLPPELSPPPGWTKEEEEAAGHALLFGLLGVAASLWYATSDAARRAPQRTLAMTLLALWLFGGITEVGQDLLTESRTAQLSDLAFDVLGALLGFFGGSVLWRLLLARFVRPSSS